MTSLSSTLPEHIDRKNTLFEIIPLHPEFFFEVLMLKTIAPRGFVGFRDYSYSLNT
jgi:hypothetical protein